MKKTLNSEVVQEAMQKTWAERARLGAGVPHKSRCCYENGINGDGFPRPDKLLKLGIDWA